MKIMSTNIYDTDTDILRIICSFFVILIHSSYPMSGYGIFFNAISRFSVPVFIIISGYYMIGSNTDLRDIKKRALRLFFTVIAWSGIYYIYGIVSKSIEYKGIRALITYLLTEPIHLWFMYALIILYILTPVSNVFCKNASKKEYIYALALMFCFGTVLKTLSCVKEFYIVSVIVDKSKIDICSGMLLLYMSGYYLRKFDTNIKSRSLLIAGISASAFTVVGTFLLYEHYPEYSSLLLSFTSPNVIIAAFSFYITAKRAIRKYIHANEKMRNIIHIMSSQTKGIYLLHPLFIIIAKELFTTADNMSYIAIPASAACIFIISLVIVWIIKQIPIVRRLV